MGYEVSESIWQHIGVEYPQHNCWRRNNNLARLTRGYFFAVFIQELNLDIGKQSPCGDWRSIFIPDAALRDTRGKFGATVCCSRGSVNEFRELAVKTYFGRG